jgi:hypothetical protein
MKLKFKGKRFNDVLETQQNLQLVLNNNTNKDFQTCSHDGRITGLGIFAPNGITLKRT